MRKGRQIAGGRPSGAAASAMSWLRRRCRMNLAPAAGLAVILVVDLLVAGCAVATYLAGPALNLAVVWLNVLAGAGMFAFVALSDGAEALYARQRESVGT